MVDRPCGDATGIPSIRPFDANHYDPGSKCIKARLAVEFHRRKKLCFNKFCVGTVSAG